MKNIFQKPDQWVSVVECNNCKNQIPTKETHIVSVEGQYFGVDGYMNVRICKECYREEQLDKLFKSEKQE